MTRVLSFVYVIVDHNYMEPAGKSFKDIIQDEFTLYKSKNSRCSLRSFAKYLGVPTTTLHQYLTGLHEPNRKNLLVMASRLRWSEQMVEDLLSQVPQKASAITGGKKNTKASAKASVITMTAKLDPEKIKMFEQDLVKFLHKMEEKYDCGLRGEVHNVVVRITA